MSSRLEKILLILSAAVLFSPILADAATDTVKFANMQQYIDGFGGSSAWEGAFSDNLMDAIYNNSSNQLGFTILRCRIDPHDTGWAAEKSNATKAKARGATVFATPWSPPESLKTKNSVIGGAINPSKYASFADWMKRFWTYVGTDNIDIMSIENEPDYSPNYECSAWSAAQFRDFCKSAVTLIGKPIMMPESENFKFSLSDTTLNDSVAASHISYIGGHLYGVQPQKYTKALNLGKHVWMTEWNASDYSAGGCMTLAKQILDCMYNNMSAYVYWWMTANGNGLISASCTPNKYGWVIAMFAKWVRPGYYRVDATYQPQTKVYVVAFKGTQNVVVAVNTNTSSQNVTFMYANTTVTSVQKYTSSSSKNAANDGTISATNNSYTVALDAQSVTTLVSTGNVSVITPRVGQNTIEKQRCVDVMTNFVYLISGKRLDLPGATELGNRASGMYIMPGNTQIGIGPGKSLHVSKK